MDELYEELDGRELALLELYRDAGGPSPEVEDRLLTKIQAQIAIEEDLASDDRSLLAPGPITAKDAGAQMRPLTAVAIAIVAFAAGVALTCGLRGQMAQLRADEHAPSVSPMTAEEPGPHELAPTPDEAEACEATVIEKRVEVPVRIEVPVRDDDEFVEEDRRGRPPTAAPTPFEGDDRDEQERDDATALPQRHAVAMAPWQRAGTDDRGENEESKRGSGAHRPSRGGALWGVSPTSGPQRPGSGSQSGGASSPAPNGSDGGGSSNGGTSDGSGQDNGGNGSGDGNAPGNAPGNGSPGDDVRPGDPGPGDPPPPPSKPDSDGDPREPGGGEPPPDDDGDDGSQTDEDPCYVQLETCMAQTDPWCEQDPVACSQVQLECDYMYQVCEYPEAMLQCDQMFNDCFAHVDSVCAQEEQVEYWEQCGELYNQCSLEYESCLGMYGDDEGEGTGESGGQIELECDELEQNCW